jgi:FkbM family methyltransferase
MMPDTADQLETHIEINALANATVTRAALTDQAGGKVIARVEPGKYGQARITADDAVRPSVQSEVEVPTTTFDDLLVGSSRVRMLKMDLEGAELAALRGGTRLLERTDFVVYESWAADAASSAPVHDHFTQHGFQIRKLDGNNWLATHT